MIIRLDPNSGAPPYEQIRTQITTMIAAGVLPGGAKLPTIRQLAKDLGVAGGTVSRAYKELESAGLIRSRGRGGTFVAPTPIMREGVDRRERLDRAARVFAFEVRQLGIPTDVALDQARTAIEDFG